MTVFKVGDVLESHVEFCLRFEDIVAGRTFIASITRWGKSWLTRKIVESCFGHAGIILVDPEGEYSSLREKFPFLIIGKDVPLQLETAEFMAEKVLESKISVIIDTSMIEDEETAKKYLNLFLRKFFFLETTLRQPYLVVVEEAEDFAGERGIGSQTCLGILINIVKKGGKRGIGSVFIAHRPAWVSKGVLSQCRNKAIGAIESTDFKALEDYARVPAEVIQKLPSLQKGEFCFVGDWVEKTTFVKVGQVQTTHLGYTPDLMPPSPKELQGVIESLQVNLKAFVEHVKPSLPDVDTLRKDAEAKAEAKAEDRLKSETQKIEAQFKDKIGVLEASNKAKQEKIDSLSRQASVVGSASPLTDVFEHPIVKNNLEKLEKRESRAKDILVRVQRDTEAGRFPSREELAAFVTASQDTVKNLVEIVNTIFHAEVIIGEGRPMRYRSMLSRLYITDVARREIEHIEELQAAKASLEQKIREVESSNGGLKSELSEAKVLLKTYITPEKFTALQNDYAALREKVKLMGSPEQVEKLKQTVNLAKQALKESMDELKGVSEEHEYLVAQFGALMAVGSQTVAHLGELSKKRDEAAKVSGFTEVLSVVPEVVLAPKSAEPLMVPAAQVGPAPMVAGDVFTPTLPAAEHLKVLSFLKAHAGQVFSAFELSLALDLSEEKVCEAAHVVGEIAVSQAGFTVKSDVEEKKN